ncbi:MAG: glycosyltransferase family 2 protein [Candidatus Heimdallarchaeaceae archaeon]
MRELTIVIPARNEEFLINTIEDILKNKRANTEIIVGIDGEWKHKLIIENPDVTIIYYPNSIGQRAITNQCVKLARGKYIMKVDAHCSFDEGFDQKMLDAFKETGDNVAMVPFMRNLHVYDWKCYKCGKRIYQDKGNICPVCGTKMKKKMLWKPRRGTWNSAYCFDPTPKFQYHSSQKIKQREMGDIVETMSLQGSCFMVTKEKYHELNLCDENFGSWGSQGIEVACKFWLSGGKVLCNRKTWYAHCFRTKSVFGFPYKLSGRQVEHAKTLAKHLFFKQKWPKQIHPLSWLVEKFWPVKGWEDKDLQDLKDKEKLL